MSFGILGVGLGVERGLGVLEPLLEVGLLVAELQPVVQHGGFVLGFLVAFDLLQPGGDVGLVHLVEFGERAFLAAVFLLQLGHAGGDAFQLGGELVDGLPAPWRSSGRR